MFNYIRRIILLARIRWAERAIDKPFDQEASLKLDHLQIKLEDLEAREK